PTVLHSLSLHDALPIWGILTINSNEHLKYLFGFPTLEKAAGIHIAGTKSLQLIEGFDSTLTHAGLHFEGNESLRSLPDFNRLDRSEEHTSELQSRENLV